MIRMLDNLFIGNSSHAMSLDVECVLNVAKDLAGARSWPRVEYMQVGLVDGPGNPMSSYYAAVMALHSLVSTGKKVLVHCHEGKSRSVIVALMYMNVTLQRTLEDLIEILKERTDSSLPDIHQAHRVAFSKMDFESMRRLMYDH